MTAIEKGRNQTFIFNTYGIMVAIVILFLLGLDYSNPFILLKDIFNDFTLNIICGITSLYLASYFIGGWAGQKILMNNNDKFSIGIISSISVLSIGIVGGSLVGLIQEGFWDRNTLWTDDVFDYLIKPLIWINVFGLIPAIILGLLLGRNISKQ